MVPMVITSREGQVDFRKRNAMLNGAVRMERADGSVLETEQLAWDEGRKMLRAQQSVLITTPAYTFRGTSLDADITEQHVTLKGRVQGEIRGTRALPRPS
jgi:LPS export ABC transporter protein LptC